MLSRTTDASTWLSAFGGMLTVDPSTFQFSFEMYSIRSLPMTFSEIANHNDYDYARTAEVEVCTEAV